jgi:hypothetical protein
MSNNPQYRTITTTQGDTVHLVELQGENPKPHSIHEAAWTYADGRQEYYIYGLKHTQSSWEKAITYYKKTKRVSNNDQE